MGIPAESALNTIGTLNWNIIYSEEYVDIVRDMKKFALNKGYLKEDYNLDEKIVLEPMKLAFPEMFSN